MKHYQEHGKYFHNNIYKMVQFDIKSLKTDNENNTNNNESSACNKLDLFECTICKRRYTIL